MPDRQPTAIDAKIATLLARVERLEDDLAGFAQLREDVVGLRVELAGLKARITAGAATVSLVIPLVSVLLGKVL